MTEWTKEEDEAFNEVEKQSNLGKQILRDRANKSSGMDCCTYDCVQGRNCPVRIKALEEVALEIDKIYEAHHNQYGECESVNFGYERAIEAKLKEKNTWK